jgi:uncharacterized iron-regulated protein
LHDLLGSARYVLLGETHDNRDHHSLQAALLDEFLSQHTEAQVGFEMLDEDDVPVLSEDSFESPRQFADRVAWDASGWPEFALYQPIIEVALAHHAPLMAAHPSNSHVRASMQTVAETETQSLHLDVALPADQIQAQYSEIREGHCGHAPEAMLSAMQRAQAYKDAFMARSMIRAKTPVALIAGRGHVRNDRAVPYFLHRHGATSSLSVAFLEVDDARAAPGDYDISGFDIVVFTPRVSDVDPCEQFRQQLERMRHEPTHEDPQPQ